MNDQGTRPQSLQEIEGDEIKGRENGTTHQLFSLEIEAALIGSLLRDNSYIKKICLLTSSDFYSQEHVEIFNTLMDHYQKNGKVDSLMLHDSMANRALSAKAMEYQNHSYSSANAPWQAQQLKNYSLRRQALQENSQQRKDILQGKGVYLSNVGKPLPLPSGRPSVMPFNYNMIPACIGNYIRDVTERYQCPPDFVAIAAICGLSGILGNKALVCPKANDDWTITPTQWGALIGRPSTMKTPSLQAALDPIYEIEKSINSQHEEHLSDYEIKLVIEGIKHKNKNKTLDRLVKNGEEEKAKLLLRETTDTTQPIKPRIAVNDCSIEKLGELLNENPNGLILIRDELSGWLAKLNQEECQGDRAFYLECFNGNGSYTFDRIIRGTTHIKNCTLSLIGGIQPSKLSQLIRGAIYGTNDDGLIQRMQLAVWPDDISSYEWIDRAPNAEARETYYATFQKIHDLNFGNESPKKFRFSYEAQILFIEWMNEIQQKARSKNIHPALEAYLIKMSKTVAGLALLFELVGEGKDAVSESSLAMALDFSEYLISHAERIFSIAGTAYIDNANLILNRKNKLPSPFTERDILRKGWTGMTDPKDVTDALTLLLEHRYIIEASPSSRSSNATARTFVWNELPEENS